MKCVNIGDDFSMRNQKVGDFSMRRKFTLKDHGEKKIASRSKYIDSSIDIQNSEEFKQSVNIKMRRR